MGILKVALVMGAVLLFALAALVVTSAYGRWRWDGLTQGLMTQLDAGRAESGPARFDAGELDELPSVVQRFFRTALTDGTPMIGAATVHHTGSFNMGETTDRWARFQSRQRVVTRQPGFVWDGRIALLPGLGVHVHDAYIAGEGILQPAILGLFKLADLRGGGALAEGELMRFLAEAAWYPTALLPSQGVRWEAVDGQSARATLTDAGVTISLTFRFDTQGLIESVRADARGRTVGGQVVMRPWEGRWSNYQWQNGMRVPMSGEVAWLLPAEEGGRKPYWRGTITSLAYEWVR